MLHNLLFKAIFDQNYPNLGRLCNMLIERINESMGIDIGRRIDATYA